MKKLLAITLTLCMIFSVIMVAPVSAEGRYLNKDIAANATAHFMTFVNNKPAAGSVYEGYTADKAIDGDSSTICYGAQLQSDKKNHFSGNLVYLDLGQPYDLTNVAITYATSTQYVDARTALGASFDKTMNQNSVAFVSNVEPVFTAGALTSNYTALNNTTLASGTETYQYVGVYVPYSSGVAIAEISVKANVWANHVQTVNKQIAPVAAGFSGNNFTNANNVADSICDGSEATMAIVRGYGNALYVDLGTEYEVANIQVVIPSNDAISSYITSAGITQFTSVGANTMYIKVGTTVPVTGGNWGTRLNTDSQDVGTGKTKSYNNVGNIRYISIESRGSSAPSVVSEIRVMANVTEEFVPEVEITNTKTQYGVESDGNLALEATITAEYKSGGSNYATYDHSYLIDNDPSTVALIGGRAVYSSSTAATPAIVILDLGEAKKLTSIKLDPIAESEKSSFVAGLDVGNISNAGNVNGGVHVFVSNTLPTYDEPGEQISKSQIATAESSDYTLYGTTAYRYVAIKNLAGSYPAAFSGITIKDNTVQKEKLRFFFNVEHNVNTVDSFGAYVIGFDRLLEGQEAKDSEDESREEAINVIDGASLTSGSTYAVDVTDIPEDGYDTNIVVQPFITFEGVHYFGNSVMTTVNKVLATQAQ